MTSDTTNVHAPAPTLYRNVGLLLGLLLVSTVCIQWVPLGRLNLVVALGIACAKAMLVALYFMHLRQANRVNRIFAATGLMWLAILIALTLADYVHRA